MTAPDKVSRIVDPIIGALIDRLPPIGSVWPLDERLLWLTTCEAALNLIYGPVDRVVLNLPTFIREPMDAAERERLETALRERGSGQVVIVDKEEEPPKRAAPETMSTAVAGAALLQGAAELEVVGDETSAGIQPTEAALKALMKPARPGPKPRDVESTRRPEGIPTTFGMIRDVLEEKPGLTAREVAAEMAKRWWPGLQFKTIGPDISTGVSKFRLNRDADGRLTLTDRGRSLVSTDARVANVGTFPKKAEETIRKGSAAKGVDPAAVMAIAKIESKPAAAPAPVVHKPLVRPPPAGIKFEHNGRTTMLATAREYSVVGKLRVAMGKGHVPESFLASSVFGSDTENNRNIIRDVCLGLNDRLAEVGLVVEHHKGFGLLMKEIAG